MIQWYWVLIAWVIGEIMGFVTIIICLGGKSPEENEKAADAGTSTAGRKTVRKDYFL